MKGAFSGRMPGIRCLISAYAWPYAAYTLMTALLNGGRAIADLKRVILTPVETFDLVHVETSDLWAVSYLTSRIS